MPDSEFTDAFVAKIDTFASSLEPEEQAMLIELLTSADDVAGFGAGPPWPGLMKLGVGHVASTAGADPDSLVAHELTHITQQLEGETKG